MRILLLSVWLMRTAVASAPSPISSGQTQCLPLREGNRYVGIRLQQQGRVLADVRFNAHDALYAMKAQTQGEQLVFSDFRTDGTWQVGSDATVRVAFTPGNAFPLVSFRVPVKQFSAAAWEAKHGKEPLHIFDCSLPGAPIFHQRGWVIPTPVVDDYVMHGAFGTAGATVVSAWSPDWTYAPAIGAYPVPVVGLWKPEEGRYVGYEFFDARLSDHSEHNIGSAYCWESGGAKEFFCLTLPYARPYNQLRYPQNGDVFAARFRVLFHTAMRHEDDPNLFVNEVMWSHLPRPLLAKEGSEGRYRDRLTSAPPLNDLLWLPAPYRLERFPTPALGRLLYRTKGDPFSLDGNLESYGVGWDSPIDYVYATKKEAALAGLREDLNQLAKLAVRFEVNGEPCVYWRKPMEGDWKPHFGKGVPTLPNVNGWLIGTAFLDAYRNERRVARRAATDSATASRAILEWLPIIDGVLRWTKYILYTRNCYPDVPAAMFAWDAAPVAAFCLKYHFTFRDDPPRRELAPLALKLARSMTYRCLPIFASDNTPDDNIDASFFMEPNSGLPWLGAACANEQVVTSLPNRFPFPSDGDLRWRPMVNIWTEQEAKYTPVLTLKDDKGTLYGDGIAMLEFLQGEFKGARIVYLWHRLIANPEWANNILSDVLTYLANQTPPPLAQIAVPRVSEPPKIDGALDDVAWKNAAAVKLDWRFHPRHMPAFVALTPTVRTSAKLLWDDRFLYVGFECEDADAWATYTKRDAYLWEEEVVEVYLDPSGKGKHYKEFEVNPIGALIDLDILEAVNGNPGDVPSHLRWNARDIRWAAKAQGTTDNRSDKDRGWTVEMAIPLEDCLFAGEPVGAVSKHAQVFIGDRWRAQFYRIERAKDSTNETAEFQAWSPTDTFHRPERFGILHFAGDPKRGDFARYRSGSDGSPTWKISAGQWQMRDGVYVGGDCIEDGWQPRGASVGDATWKDYTVRVRYRVAQRGSDWRDGFWLGFRCGDAGCYALEFTHREAQLHKVPASGGYNGDEHPLAVTPFTPDAHWHDLVVRVRGNRIEIEQDGRPLLSYHDDKPLASGGVTLCARKWSGSTGNTVVEISEFKIE